jgi:hypothetical protein
VVSNLCIYNCILSLAWLQGNVVCISRECFLSNHAEYSVFQSAAIPMTLMTRLKLNLTLILKIGLPEKCSLPSHCAPFPPCLRIVCQKYAVYPLPMPLFLCCSCMHLYTHTHTHTHSGKWWFVNCAMKYIYIENMVAG